jgi:uncharacterized protein
MDAAFEDRLIRIVQKSTTEKSIEEWSTLQDSSETPIFNYRYDHVTLVVELAKHLAIELNADLDIITMAGWLHDVAKPGMSGVRKHGEKSADIAREMLRAEGVEVNTIERVCDVIEKHVGLTLEQPLQPLEAQILWEADKLVKLGATGIIHNILNVIRIKPGMRMEKISEEMARSLDLAKEIASSMDTIPGKRLAQIRLDTIQRFCNSLEDELRFES